MYTKILVPLDGSATAEAALPYVEALAVGFKTSVELLSVIDVGAMTAYLSADKVPQLDGIVGKEEENSRTYLESVVKNYSASFTATCQVVRGDPAEAILEASSKDRNILIAMATHGHSGAKRWLLGSIAEKVLRNSTCPVFLVRASEAETEAADHQLHRCAVGRIAVGGANASDSVAVGASTRSRSGLDSRRRVPGIDLLQQRRRFCRLRRLSGEREEGSCGISED